MGNCGNCQYYGTAPVAGPICTKTGKATSFLAVKDCFEARTTGPEILTKRCNRCHRELPLAEFSRNHTQRDGYQRQCKDCQREIAQAAYKKKAEEKAEEPVPPAPPTTKVCTKCKRELPLERFGRNVRATDGLKCYCKDCENENCRTYRSKKYGKSRQKQKPDPDPTALPEPKADISVLTDDEIIAELRRRGWHGRIIKDSIDI